jgi:hypothetical protein
MLEVMAREKVRRSLRFLPRLQILNSPGPATSLRAAKFEGASVLLSSRDNSTSMRFALFKFGRCSSLESGQVDFKVRPVRNCAHFTLPGGYGMPLAS